jgi:hypothetical protein
MAGVQEAVDLIAAFVLEEAELLADRRNRQFRTREDPFSLPDHHFVKLFRLDKDTAMDLIGIVDQYLERPSRVSALDSTVQVENSA